MAFNVNITLPLGEPDWGDTAPAWRLPVWAEPIMVASILVGSMIITRKKGFHIFSTTSNKCGLIGDEVDLARTSRELWERDYMVNNTDESASMASFSTMKNPPNRRFVCGLSIYTPNTSQFEDYYHSRLLQKFPFLIEMFYWIITYAFYRCTSLMSQAIFSTTGIWDVAQDHGLAILQLEQESWMSFLWPVQELEVQKWFMDGHQTFLTVLNRSYALIHIPGTVGFIAWYYHVAPSHSTFAVARRTMTLTNLFAFIMFISYPCMPPRLLPQEYGFLDTVGRNKAQSVWMSGKYVNSLAAMPSMHFGYAFCIGSTFMYHSGVFRKALETGERRKSTTWAIWYCLLAIAYPSWILITIVATANHYYLDACIAFFVVLAAYLCNRVFLVLLPIEDLLLWCLRVDKPKPSTGDRLRQYC